MTDDAPWLSDDEQQVWRRWLAVTSALPVALHRGLRADTGLSLPDFDVLVQLTDGDAARIRMGDLATALSWERSRLSHHVLRMEKRGLVQREECEDDGRGSFVVLTDLGRSAIERAAPEHVRTVRRLVFDPLTADEVATLGALLGRIGERIGHRIDDGRAN